LTGPGDQPDCILIEEAATGIVNRSLEFGVATQLRYRIAMKRDEAISRLKQHEADLKRLGVEHLYMFGSTARGEAKDDSDVDLFFDYETRPL
jgi:predicted nucleotidyltransferase